MFLDAFSDLNTLRSFEGGAIPFDKILWYAVEILGLDLWTGQIFTSVIREMDMVYQEWVQKEREKDRPRPSSTGSQPSRSPGTRGARRPPARRR